MARILAPSPDRQKTRTAPLLPNYRMSERALHTDFSIRSQDTALPNPAAHRHEYFQIHVQLAGTTQHFLGSTRRPVQPGTVCFVQPYKTHFIPTVPKSSYYILNVSLGYLLPSLNIDMPDLAGFPLEGLPKLAPFRFQEQIDFVLGDRNIAMVRDLCEALMQEDEHRSPGSTLMIRGYLLQLIGVVWRQYGEALTQFSMAHVSPAVPGPGITRLFAYLRERLDQPVSLAQAAAAVHLSPTYLAHLVKRETGQTFVEMLTMRRIARAKELLLHTNLSVKEIAFRTGFSDTAYFGRRFNQIEGCSPSRARELLRIAPA